MTRLLSVMANWPSRKKRLARLGGDPVRIAAASIQEGEVGLSEVVLRPILISSFLISNGLRVSNFSA